MCICIYSFSLSYNNISYSPTFCNLKICKFFSGIVKDLSRLIRTPPYAETYIRGRGEGGPPTALLTALWQTELTAVWRCVKRLSAYMLNVCQSSMLSLPLSSLLYLYVNTATLTYTSRRIGVQTAISVALSFILSILALFLMRLIHLRSIKVSPFKANAN